MRKYIKFLAGAGQEILDVIGDNRRKSLFLKFEKTRRRYEGVWNILREIPLDKEKELFLRVASAGYLKGMDMSIMELSRFSRESKEALSGTLLSPFQKELTQWNLARWTCNPKTMMAAYEIGIEAGEKAYEEYTETHLG